jgi:hypothetical protein
MNLLLDVNAIRQDAERTANLESIRNALAQPRVISPKNGHLRPMPLRSLDPHRPTGTALLDALARR